MTAADALACLQNSGEHIAGEDELAALVASWPLPEQDERDYPSDSGSSNSGQGGQGEDALLAILHPVREREERGEQPSPAGKASSKEPMAERELNHPVSRAPRVSMRPRLGILATVPALIGVLGVLGYAALQGDDERSTRGTEHLLA